ncbi:hypothetical protein STEG23_014908 [Scotinomys teguina]
MKPRQEVGGMQCKSAAEAGGKGSVASSPRTLRFRFPLIRHRMADVINRVCRMDVCAEDQTRVLTLHRSATSLV